MKAAPLLVSWHNENAAIYSAHFEPHGKGRLATAGGDNNVRLWKVEGNGEERKVTYLSTLIKHTQAVNVVRWAPKGELLASAGDDGNVLLWVPSENQSLQPMGEDGLEDKETWRVKHMCRSMGTEIYDLAWSPDGAFFITGSMDNVARIYNSHTATCVRQIAEHNHYVQGVAWDPLNEYVATQSSDRSIHIYTLKTKDGQFSLAQHNKVTKMDLPARRISSSSPAPPDIAGRTSSFVTENSALGPGSPVPSAPGTPASLVPFSVNMNPPPTSHSRRSSFGSSPSMRRSVSPAPSLPLPAVMPTSPNVHALGVRNAALYANETFTSFFRRLTFSPDGSLLFTPAGQYKTTHPSTFESSKMTDDITNTVYIYTRAGFHKPPVAYLPGHKKPSVVVRCSPIFYTLRTTPPLTKNITIDTSSADDEILSLPEPALATKPSPAPSTSMDPPPLASAPSPAASMTAASPKPEGSETSSSTLPAGPPSVFALPYRVVYAVATQDAVYVYDTQQQKPLCIISNLHFATFTDLTWSNDGSTLLMTSSDGFCSCLTFSPGELGQVYHGSTSVKANAPTSINTNTSSTQSTPTPTPTSTVPPVSKQASSSQPLFPASPASFATARPASPARSMSQSSMASQPSFPPSGESGVLLSNATPISGHIPSVSASTPGTLALWTQTPPMTPMTGGHGTHSASSSVSGVVHPHARRESESESDIAKETKKRAPEQGQEQGSQPKKRRIAPTLVSTEEESAPQ